MSSESEMSSQFVPYDQVRVLALDSVCWDVLLPLVEDGTMPILGAFLKSASYGILESTIPPHSATAWTTWLTGKEPGLHGVLDFVRFDPGTHRFRFHDSSVQRDSSILSILSQAGISAGSIFLPRNYPPYPLKNGYMVSGFETPNVDSQFTNPPDLRDEILQLAPELLFQFEEGWEKDTGDDAAFERNIGRAIYSVDVLELLATHLQKTRPTRFQVAYLQTTDIVFHKAWKWCDAASKQTRENPMRRALIQTFFRRIDDSIARVLELNSGDNPRTLRLICSDHGHGSSDGRVFVNNLLREWGYLKPLGGFDKFRRRLTSFSFKKLERKQSNKEMALDWSQTKAYMAHVGIHGFVYLNKKGREPHGIVTRDEFDTVRNALIEKFRAVKIPGTDLPVFQDVWKGEDIYARKEELNLPDIVLGATNGYFPRNKLSRSFTVRATPNTICGVHRPDGVYAFSGPGIRPSNGEAPRASIADICPTLLAAMGLPIPADVTGKAMQHIFETKPNLHIAANAAHIATAQPVVEQPVYTSEEQQAVEKRLADLGYLE
ncbi:MAG: alkaline phosphatase family protein [Planctomycetota bacterium]